MSQCSDHEKNGHKGGHYRNPERPTSDKVVRQVEEKVAGRNLFDLLKASSSKLE